MILFMEFHASFLEHVAIQQSPCGGTPAHTAMWFHIPTTGSLPLAQGLL